MVVGKPYCGFRYCRYNFDGNCMDESRYRDCEFQSYKKLYNALDEDSKQEYDCSEAVKKHYQFIQNLGSKNYKAGYEKAMAEINQPMSVIIDKWESTECPRCGKNFYEYEESNEGHWKRAINLERCPYCGQKITWN